jgi:hypothetical protein
MIPFLLSILGLGKSVLTAVLTWLSRRSLAELCLIALAVYTLCIQVALLGERRHAAKLQTQVTNLSVQLQRISDARKTQQIVTREKIKIVTQRIHDADGKAKVIEQAPLPGGCKSPQAVMDADI